MSKYLTDRDYGNIGLALTLPVWLPYWIAYKVIVLGVRLVLKCLGLCRSKRSHMGKKGGCVSRLRPRSDVQGAGFSGMIPAPLDLQLERGLPSGTSRYNGQSPSGEKGS